MTSRFAERKKQKLTIFDKPIGGRRGIVGDKSDSHKMVETIEHELERPNGSFLRIQMNSQEQCWKGLL
jgi:hypothetical protein